MLAYGGVFGRLGQLKPGDRVLTATTEGQSIYVVRRVATVTIGSAAETGVGTDGDARDALPAHVRQPPDVGDFGLFLPWNSSRAIEVTAILRGKPYVATPQEARDSSQLGNTGESGAWAELILSLRPWP